MACIHPFISLNAGSQKPHCPWTWTPKGMHWLWRLKGKGHEGFTLKVSHSGCMSWGPTGNSQNNTVCLVTRQLCPISGFQPGKALRAQGSKIQKLVREDRQEAWLASVPTQNQHKVGAQNCLMNEWMNGQMFTLLWSQVVRSFKAWYPSIWCSSHQEVGSLSPHLNLSSVAVW